MHPDDRNGTKPPHERPLRVLIIAGSNRRQYNCPGVDSKARAFMMRMADRLPGHWEIDYEDLGNVYARALIRSCNACVSTSMALCCWPCNCYAPDDRHEPDLMWDLDLYARLDLADAWLIIGPVNWYAPASNLKLMFDRLVCMNGGNPREDLIEHKDPELAMRLEHDPSWRELSRNHLEGRTAAFFCYGDDGADEIGPDGRPQGLSRPEWFDPSHEPFAESRDAYAPLVWQCRYSGIEVPDELWRHQRFGHGRPYSDNQAEDIAAQAGVYAAFDAWTDAVVQHVGAKGQVPPGPWRAYGREPSGHRWQDLKLAWRDRRMRLGVPRAGSSPEQQQEQGLNRDVGWNIHRSEGEKLRDPRAEHPPQEHP
ncbi:MAG: NAD(P)H-dependent oxidoreductase [Planctomycetes bacterium]|nr:NAD(P)H-dependent oxidoreductase [Planctomycetota bacterium]